MAAVSEYTNHGAATWRQNHFANPEPGNPAAVTLQKKKTKQNYRLPEKRGN